MNSDIKKINESLMVYMGKLAEAKKVQKKGGLNSERSEVVFQLLQFMGEELTLKEEKELEKQYTGAGRKAKIARIGMRMKYWLGRTRHLSSEQIYKLISEAKLGKNQQATLNYLLKTKYAREKI